MRPGGGAEKGSWGDLTKERSGCWTGCPGEGEPGGGRGPWEEGSGGWGLGLIRTLAKEKRWHDGQKGLWLRELENSDGRRLGLAGPGM